MKMNEKISRLITNISLIGSLMELIKQIAKSQIMAMEADDGIIDAELLTQAYSKMYANEDLNSNETRQLNWHSYANFCTNYKYWQFFD